MQRFPYLWCLLILGVLLTGCTESAGKAPAGNGTPTYVASVKPLALVLQELTAGRGEVRTLLSPAASPHTYEPKPSDARAVADALVFFHVGTGLDDWASDMQSKRRVAVMDLLPEEHHLMTNETCTDHDHAGHEHDHDHAHGIVDPHYWTDPLAVAATIPGLVEKLAEADPKGAATYVSNGEKLKARLTALDATLREELGPIRGAKVVLFHPSFLYMLRRYELAYVGSVEVSPGREATPRYLAELGDKLRAEGVKAVFSEPQLNSRPAEALAREGKVKLALLDPHGAVEGTDSYENLLLYNARALRTALQ